MSCMQRSICRNNEISFTGGNSFVLQPISQLSPQMLFTALFICSELWVHIRTQFYQRGQKASVGCRLTSSPCINKGVAISVISSSSTLYLKVQRLVVCPLRSDIQQVSRLLLLMLLVSPAIQGLLRVSSETSRQVGHQEWEELVSWHKELLQ